MKKKKNMAIERLKKDHRRFHNAMLDYQIGRGRFDKTVVEEDGYKRYKNEGMQTCHENLLAARNALARDYSPYGDPKKDQQINKLIDEVLNWGSVVVDFVNVDDIGVTIWSWRNLDQHLYGDYAEV
jgi:hypothetical protein